jgi:hypothetical protein
MFDNGQSLLIVENNLLLGIYGICLGKMGSVKTKNLYLSVGNCLE